MTRKQKIRRILFIILAGIILLVVTVIAVISPVTKHLIEKYDVQLTGRQISMDRAYVNPFSGFVYFSNVRIYEQKSDSLFLTVRGLSGNFVLYKLFAKSIEISELILDQPKGFVIQNDKRFNFDDIIKKFTVKKSDKKAPAFLFNILHIKIKNGEFHYLENHYPVNYYIKNVNIESKGKLWRSDTLNIQFSLFSGTRNGDLKGNLAVNLKTMNYQSDVKVHKFDLTILEPYFKDLTNYGCFAANLDADLKSKGNFRDPLSASNSGMMAVSDFHLGKDSTDDYASFDKLVFAIKEMNTNQHIYLYDSVTIIHPTLKYERYDRLDNIQTMFGKGGSNIRSANARTAQFNLVVGIANYLKSLSKNFFQSDFKVDHFGIYDGDIRFNDYSCSEKFAVQLNPFNVRADSLDKHHRRVNVFLKSSVRPYGNISAALSMNPKDSGNFELKYHLGKIPVSLFNPYIISLTSFPLDRGTLTFEGKWYVRNGIIRSNNHLLITNPGVTKRIKNKDLKNLPVPLILSMIRERGNVIDYEIPVTGNLKNPTFHLQDVLSDLLRNIFVKTPTTAYRKTIKNIEPELEKSRSLKWGMRQTTLQPNQEKFIKQLSKFLQKNKDAVLTVYPQIYAIKEQEYILFFEAKKKYFLASQNKKAGTFNTTDSMTVDKMSIRNASFNRYLNNHTSDTLAFTLQEKCALLIPAYLVHAKFEKLNKQRTEAFLLEFKNRKVEKQIKIAKAEYNIPYNGFSFYKFDCNAEFPASLIRAYQKMNE